MENTFQEQTEHVFISYARSDFSYAEKIKNQLEQAGIDCWLDTEDIKPGDKWLPSLQKALHQAQAMVVVCSHAAENSDYMEREFHLADELGVRIIPVIIEGQIPFHLKDRNAIFLTENWQAGMQQLTVCLSASVAQALTQREAELNWLDTLTQQLNCLYTPLQGISRQSQSKNIVIPQQMVQHSVLEHLARNVATEQPETTQQYEDVQTAFSQVSRAVLLGVPGAGKTTTLRKLATEQIEQAKKLSDAAIPLFISLGEWRDEALPFSAYLEQQLGPLGSYLPVLLQQQRAVLLLDGLNETPSGMREIKALQLRQWLQNEAHQPLSCYITCRDLDYTSNMELGLDTISIKPLDPPRIRAFLQDYLPLMMGESGKNAALDLFWTLGGGTPLREAWEVWQQAGASEQQFWGSDVVPRENPDVYTKTTVQQDEIWHYALHNPHSMLHLAANPFMLSMLAVVYAKSNECLPKNRAQLFTEFVETLLRRENLLEQQTLLLPGLQQLAWAMQRQSENQDRNVQTTMPRSQALNHIDEPQLKQATRANLLDAGDDVRFSHQLLQEYFTALTMHDLLEKNQLDANQLWPVTQFWKPTGWEEATVLLSGLYGTDCSKALHWLLPVHPEMLVRCIQETAVPYQDDILDTLKNHWQDAMLNINQWPEPAARASIARALGNLELDTRTGIGLNKQGLPDIDWVSIPGGNITLENDAGTFTVEAFQLARYPVTNAQFDCFINDPEGCSNPRWWQGLETQAETAAMPRWRESNHPRESVSWFEAMAFCAWLSERLGKSICLPTEWQWQQAVCSGQSDFSYPWGPKYKSGFANINETWDDAGSEYLGRTSAVGLYPQGNSRQGVSDLSGNVWEWCLNEYGTPGNIQSAGHATRVLRGGAWHDNLVHARASSRSYLSPYDRDSNIGFRLCCLSPI